MELKDRKDGICYYTSTGFVRWIYYHNGCGINVNKPVPNGNYFQEKEVTLSGIKDDKRVEELRLATTEEKQWLDLCIKYNKMIYKNEIKSYLYKIYELW